MCKFKERLLSASFVHIQEKSHWVPYVGRQYVPSLRLTNTLQAHPSKYPFESVHLTHTTGSLWKKYKSFSDKEMSCLNENVKRKRFLPGLNQMTRNHYVSKEKPCWRQRRRKNVSSPNSWRSQTHWISLLRTPRKVCRSKRSTYPSRSLCTHTCVYWTWKHECSLPTASPTKQHLRRDKEAILGT